MTSNPLDTRAWIAAAKRFVRLRRRFWLSFVGGWLVFGIFGLPLFLLDDGMNGVVRGILSGITFVGGSGCWLGATVAWHHLSTFRCPRCESTFVMSWTSHSFPTSRCKHCGLDLRAAAMA